MPSSVGSDLWKGDPVGARFADARAGVRERVRRTGAKRALLTGSHHNLENGDTHYASLLLPLCGYHRFRKLPRMLPDWGGESLVPPLLRLRGNVAGHVLCLPKRRPSMGEMSLV